MVVTHSETQWVACDGTPMHAVRWLPDVEPKMVVCLIHGLGEHSGRYENMAKFFASHGIEVVSFDLREEKIGLMSLRQRCVKRMES